MVKKFMGMLVLTGMVMSAAAQTVKVKQEQARIKGNNVRGVQVDLEGTSGEVSNAFNKFLKGYGKVKQTDPATLQEPTLDGTAYTTPVYIVTKDNGNTTAAWLGIVESEWKAEDVERVNKALEKMMYDFGVKFYRDKIQVQIDESARALQAVEKQTQRLTNENKSLNTKLDDNKREKIQLEKSLENNKLEYETLLKKIALNIKARDSVAVATEQIRKVVEMHKERQRKVN